MLSDKAYNSDRRVHRAKKLVRLQISDDIGTVTTSARSSKKDCDSQMADEDDAIERQLKADEELLWRDVRVLLKVFEAEVG